MKYLIILADGAADENIEALGNKTPFQFAKKPNIDALASKSQCGTLITVPDGFNPGSEIANLTILGYDVRDSFEGRGVLEAASMGIEISEKEMAMRCNLICIENDKIKNHSAGHISNAEASELIKFIQKELGSEVASFYEGVSYRHLLKIYKGDKHIDATPPHDIVGENFKDYLVKPLNEDAEMTAELINALILESQKLLKNHPVNLKRVAEGKDPANSIWPWSPGYRPNMESLIEKFHFKSGSVISAVDLIKGIGIYAGLKPIEVEGATGLWDTNYAGKVKAALEALESDDFVFLHVEASDEAGHEGNYNLKVRTIEDLDNQVVAPLIKEIEKRGEPVTIVLLPDHPTPCNIKTHTSTPVPVLVYRPDVEPDAVTQFDEESVKNGALGEIELCGLLSRVFNCQQTD